MAESAIPAYSTSPIRHFEDLRNDEALFSPRILHLSQIPIGSPEPL